VGAASENQRAAVDAVLGHFLQREHSLVSASTRDELRPDTVLDIPHESLVAKWKRLEGWVRDEAINAEWYRDAANAAGDCRSGEGALWRDPSLSSVRAIAKSNNWNEDWAAQYKQDWQPGFTEVQGFLQRSETAQRRQRILRWAGVAVVVAALGTAGVLYRNEQRAAERTRALQRELSSIQAEKKATDAKIQSLEGQLATATGPERENLLAQLGAARQASVDLKAEQTKTADLLKNNADVAAVNRTLQDRIAQLDKQRQAAVDESTTLKQQLDAANSEIARLPRPAVNAPAPYIQTPVSTFKEAHMLKSIDILLGLSVVMLMVSLVVTVLTGGYRPDASDHEPDAIQGQEPAGRHSRPAAANPS
jgi:hypothetical protein